VHLIFPKVYPITDTHLSGLSHTEQVRRLIKGGATLIQLRDKTASPGDFYRDAEAALKIARHHNVTVIINDRVDIALALRVEGIHLGQTDLPPDAARKLLGPKAFIGLSTHNLEQVHVAIKQPVDYIAFGPIYQTTTKEEPDPATGLTTLRLVRQIVGLPLVAIGGINQTNAPEVLYAGADSVATISSLLQEATSISENLREMLKSAHG
jgi:thiamine-phosphate pyrophosphorylase